MGGTLQRRDVLPIRIPIVALVSLLLGCAHDAPFSPGVYTPREPPATGPFVRLTYNPGADLGPVWLPDASGFLYTTERLDRPDRDRCLAQLPAVGGSITSEVCARGAAADDSVNAYSSPAVSEDGRLAYVRASAPLVVGWPLTPRYHELVLGTLANPQQVSVLERLPYIAPSGHTHNEASQLHWLSDSVLIYLAQRVVYIQPCAGCTLFDTVATGVEVVRLGFGTSPPSLTIVAGTDSASSIDVGGGDTLYFTVNNDSKVFRLQLATGSVAVAHDFGAGLIARDVQVAGSRLVAVVGGDVSFVPDSASAVGPYQIDHGGTVVLVDLSTGVETALTTATMFYRHPALSADGTSMIVERIVGASTDLYRVELP